MAIHLKNGTIDSIGTDTGTSSSDFVTSDQTLIIHGNISTNGHGGSLTLGIWLSGGSFGVANGGKGTLVGTVSGITASGPWSFNLTTSSVTAAQLLANGSYTIHLTNGTTIGASELASRTIDVDTTIPPVPTIASVADNVSPGVGIVFNGGNTDDTTPTISGKAEEGSTVTIFDGTTKIGTTKADSSGAWSITTAALAEGTYNFAASATDAAGNTSGTSNTYSVTIDTSAPATPTIVAVTDDMAAGIGTVPSGSSTNDTTPTLNGMADANSIVTIFDGASLIGATTGGTDGTWSFTAAPLAANGHHSFTAIATDTAGNASTTSTPYELVEDPNAICYAAGTRILTAAGERRIETLVPGDIILTLAGDQLVPRPLRWLGRRRIDLHSHPRPQTAAPVRIQHGAIADRIPHSDVLVSPDHAVLIDGKLICARQLINGTTIWQEKACTSVEYYHLELDIHAILLAEGLPAESYLNTTGTRRFFANADEPLLLHPEMTDETGYPTREAGSCRPFVWDEDNVRPVWQRLAERSEALGRPVPKLETTADPELHIVADGRTVRPLHCADGLYVFAMPDRTKEVRLVSRAGMLTDTRPWLEDGRRFGIYVDRISLRGAVEMRQVPLDHPDLSRGWWAVERYGAVLRRWTNGDAVLPLPAIAGPAALEIRASSGGMAYVISAHPERAVA